MHASTQRVGADLIRNSSLKLVFEFIGTFFLTLAFNCSQKLQSFTANQTSLLLTLWVLTIFGQRISGAHYNPALSIAQMIRKDAGNFPRLLALAYIVAQILGAFAGALVSWFLLGDFRSLYAIEMPDDNSPVVVFAKIISDSGNIYPMCKYTSDAFKKEETGETLWYKHECSAATWVVAAMLTEVLGSFFLSFFFLTQTEEKTRFGKDKAINCFIIAASYVGARSMLNGKNVTFSGAVLNPAISLGTNFTMLFDKGASYFQYFWIYALMPIGGAVLAVLFHELVFKKSQDFLQEDDGEDEGEDNLLDK